MPARRVTFSTLLACLLAAAFLASPAAARTSRAIACAAAKTTAKKATAKAHAASHRNRVHRSHTRRARARRAARRARLHRARALAICARAKRAPKPAPAPAPQPAPAPSAPPTPAPTPSSLPAGPAADASSATGGPLLLGINANTQGYAGAAPDRQATTAQTGVKWLREMFSWSTVQSSPATWDWSRYDAVMTGAAQNGLRILPVVMDTPSWAGANWASVPADPAAYATFTAKIAERYGAGGTFWQAHPELTPAPITWYEVMNEAYVDSFQPAAYARLVKATAAAVRARQAGARFVISADLKGNWVDALFSAAPDLAGSFDAVAVHPYAIDLQSTSSNPLSYGFPTTIAGVHQQLLAHGADKPLWLTEMGFSTCPGGTSAFCVSEARQAELVQQVVDTLRTSYSSTVGALFLYHYNDWGAADGDREHYFGLTRRDGSWKPAMPTLRRITGLE